MKKDRKWALGAASAAGIGYLIGILSAPRSGWRTRKKLAKSANKAKIDGEKQLKKLYSELNVLLSDADKKLKKKKEGAQTELKKQVASANKTKQKARILLSALHNGDAEDPDLKEMLAEIKKAKANLGKFFKK
ncbi:MAG TPA: YtxH domain-containing protein [Candidatus Saccharimonadales bacterium]|nr:YtxH domain-containing protein [Candidatus Saccharimonadales bacterium]